MGFFDTIKEGARGGSGAYGRMVQAAQWVGYLDKDWEKGTLDKEAGRIALKELRDAIEDMANFPVSGILVKPLMRQMRNRLQQVQKSWGIPDLDKSIEATTK